MLRGRRTQGARMRPVMRVVGLMEEFPIGLQLLFPLARAKRAAMSPLAATTARNSTLSGRYPPAQRAACYKKAKVLRKEKTFRVPKGLELIATG